MQAKNQMVKIQSAYRILLISIFVSSLVVASNSTSVHAQATIEAASIQVSGHVLSNGQFVYGPNVGDFDLKTYLQDNAPYLVKYADDLYGRSEYFSVNPK